MAVGAAILKGHTRRLLLQFSERCLKDETATRGCAPALLVGDCDDEPFANY